MIPALPKRRPLSLSLARFASAAAICAAIASAKSDAQTVWTANSATNTNWDAALNWTPGVPTAATDVLFTSPIPNPGALLGPEFIVLGNGENAKSLTFLDNYTLSSGSLNLATGAVNVGGTFTPTITSTLTGTAGLTVSGTGVLIVNGANTFTGGVTVNGGALQVSADNALGDAANGVTVDTGGTLEVAGTFASGRALTVGAGGANINIAASQALTLSTAITATANQLTKVGTGTLTLTAASTRTGITAVSQGVLRLENVSAAGTGNITVDSGATVLSAHNAATQAFAANVILNGGTFVHNPGANQQLNFAGGKSISVGAAGGTVEVSPGTGAGSKILLGGGAISSAAGSVLIKTGPGVLQLSGANSGFLGTADVRAGTVEFQNADTLGAGVKNITVSGTGDFTSSGVVVRHNFTLSSGGTISANANGNADFQGTITIPAGTTGNASLRYFQATGTANSFKISGSLAGDGDLAVNAPAAATLTLSGFNSGFFGRVLVNANAVVSPTSLASYPANGITLNGGTLRNATLNTISPINAGVPGLAASYYSFGNNPGIASSQFATDLLLGEARVVSRVDGEINIPNNGGGTYPVTAIPGFSFNTNHGVMWKGLLNISQGGSYQFSGINDDNAVLYIDGVQIGTLGVTGNTNTNIGTAINLTAGQHSIVYRFTQGTGGGYSVLNYNGLDTGSVNKVVGSVANSVTTGSFAPTDIGSVTVLANSALDVVTDTNVPSLTLSGGTLTVTSPTISTVRVVGPTTITTNSTLAPTSAALFLDGDIVGAGNLSVNGPHATTISGNNSFSGTTSVGGGQLNLNSAIGTAIPSNLTVNAAASVISNVRLLRPDQIDDFATVTVTAGTLDLGANSDTVASLVLNGGNITATTGKLTANTSVSLQSGYLGARLAGNVNVVKSGAGTVILAGASTYTGVTNVDGGVLKAIAANTLGAAGAGNGTVVAAGSQLQLASANNGQENVTIAGSGVAAISGGSALINDGAIRNLTGTSVINNLTMSSNAIVHVDGGDLIINGALNTASGTLTKTGAGSLTFASPQASIPNVTLSGGALGFSGVQNFGAVAVPAGFAYRFNSDPGAGANGITVGGTSAVIAGYALDQALLSRLAVASTGSVLLTSDSANAVSLANANVGLGALGLVTYSGGLTPNAGGYRFSSIAGQGSNVGLNELKVTSDLAGAVGLTVTGGTVHLTGKNTFSGAISLTGGTTRILNNSSLGSGGVTLNGGTLQLVNSTGNAGALFGQFGNVLSDPRTLTIGAAGGTIDVPARIGGDSGFALTGATGFSPLSGSGTLTKTGMGQLFLLNPSDFSGNLVIASSGDRLDVRNSGSLANVASITVNSRGVLLVDNQSGLGTRQFASVNNNDRINNAAPITLNGGGVLYRARGVAAQNTETFGTVSLGVGQNAIDADSNAGGTVGGILSFGTFSRVTGSTLRLGGTAGTFGAGTAGTPGANNTHVLFSGMAAAPILPYATIFGTELVQYDAALGAKIAAYTDATNAAAITPATGQNINLTSAGTTTMTAGPNRMAGLRFGGGNNAQVLAFDPTTPGTLFIEGGAIVADANAQNRDIGTATLRGMLTVGPATGAAAPQELFLHNRSGTLRIFSTIVENNGQPLTVVKDEDATVRLEAPSNTYTGGTYVLRGSLVASAVGSLGTGNVVASNSRVQLEAVGAAAAGTTLTAINNGEINLNTAGDWATNGSRYIIQSGSVILGTSNNTTANLGLNSLTRVSGAPQNGGEVLIGENSIVGHFSFANSALNGAGINTIKNLGTSADLFYGLSLDANAGAAQSVTLGAGTPWKGMSTDRNARRWSQGTIYANSDFYLQGMVRDNSAVGLSIGSPNATGTINFVNQAGRPINAYINGQVALDEDTPTSMPGDLTFVVTPGAIFQAVRPAGLGFVGSSRAKVLVQAGGIIDPGNFVGVGAAVNQPFGMPYPAISPLNGSVTVEKGGRFWINDASGIGSAPAGSYLLKSESILDLATSVAFLGSGNSLFSPGAPNTGLANVGQFTYEPGAIVRVGADNIFKLSQFVSGEANGEKVTYEIFGAGRNITNQVSPFVAQATGLSVYAPEAVKVAGGGMITNDDNDRQLNEGRGKVVLGNGAILAGTVQTHMQIQEGLEIEAGSTITIGNATQINGLSKLGSVQFTAAHSNTAGAGAKFSVINGAQMTLNTINVIPDTMGIHLESAPGAQFPATGANALFPASGSVLLLNYTGNQTEIVGPLTGNGVVILNNPNTGNPALTAVTLGAGWGATSNFEFAGSFKSYNTQNPGLFKVGPTKMSLTGVSDSTGEFGVFQGELSFSGAGQIASGVTGLVRVGKGAVLSIDDSAGALATPRLGNKSVNGQGGNLVFRGGATPVTETILQINNGSTVGDLSFINVESGTADTNLLITTIERFDNAGGRQSTWVFRGPGMAGQPGTYSSAGVYTPNPANPTTGLIRATNPNFFTNAGLGQTTGNMQGYIGTPLTPVRGDLLGDVSATGKGTGFVTQESSTTGFRLLADSEYQNFFHWNTAGNNAVNVKLNSPVVGIGGDTRVATLTMANNASITIGNTLPLNQTPSRFLINAGGLLVQPGANASINAPYLQTLGGVALSMHAQGNLTINAVTFSDTSLVKNGAGTVTFGPGTAGIWRGTFTINEGTVELGANNSFFVTRNQNGFTGQSVHLNGGTLKLNGNSQMINALNSSNILPGFGGVLSSSSVASLIIQGGGAFSGAIQGPISIDKVGNNTLLLASANSYSGSTVVRGGTLQLRDSGTLTSTSSIELVNSTVQLDNGYLSNVANRLPVGVNVVSKGGSFTLNGAAGQLAKQALGTLTLDLGQTTINNSAGGNGANEITYANIVHAANSGTMINFGQNYGFLGTPGDTTTGIRNIISAINGQPVTLTSGIIGGWAIGNGDHFATYSPTTGVGLLSNTADGFAAYGSGDLSTAGAATGAINYNDGTSRTIPTGSVVNAIRNGPGAAQTLTLSGDLNIASGGLLTNAGVSVTYNGGTITSQAGALYPWINQNTATINSQIIGNIDLVKGGGGTLALGGANTYSGKTFVNAGTLNIGATGADGVTVVAVPGDVMINGGAVAAVTVARSIKETANVTITGSGRLNMRDAATTVETLGSITFRDGGGATGTMNVDRANSQPTSTLNLTGATAITATNTNPTTGVPYFGANLGKLGFTGAGAQTINVTSPLSDHGLAAIGLRIDAQIDQIPTAGLIKTGNGLLALNPTNTGAVNFTGVTTGYDGNLNTLKNVMDVQQGILRFDNVNASGTNTANFTIQGGAGLLYRNVAGNGSVRLNAGSFLGAAEGNATLGTATTTVANQTVLNVAGNSTVYVGDYFVQGTNAITVAALGRLTGSCNINLVGPQITSAAGVFRLGNPILTGVGSNDYSGTIRVNTNTVLENQVALLAPAVRQTGNVLGTATIELNGGRLRLRDDLSDSVDVASQTITYGNNVTLLADSFLDANRQNASAAITGNTIVLGTLTVPSGTKTLTVDSGNTYGVTLTQLAGSGVLMKGGTATLTITDYAPNFTGGVGVQGSQGVGTQYAQNLVLVPTVNDMGTFVANGGYSLPGGKSLNVSGTLKVGNNAGTIANGFNGVISGENKGAFHAQAGTTVTAGVLENDGLVGTFNNDQTITAPIIRGTGTFTTVGQALTLDGNLVNGTTASKLKFTGDSTVNLTGAAHTATMEVQSGIVRIAPVSGTATIQGNVNVMSVPASTVATGANAAQAVAGIAGTLQFDAPTVAVSGNITNSGTVRVSSGMAVVTGTIAGTPMTYVPGLLEGRVPGSNSLSTVDTRPGNPGTFGIKLEPRMAQTNLLTNNPITGWSSNEMWVYTGEFYDADGKFTFAEAIDDLALLSIDGVNRIANTGNGTNQPTGTGPWNTNTNTSTNAGQQATINLVTNANAGTPTLDFGMGANNDGWHTFEVRVVNTAGGGGAGFFANFGLGLNGDGTTAFDGPVYSRPIDPGDGSLFRTKVGGAGKIQVDVGSRLNVGGFNTISEVNLAVGAGPSPTLHVTAANSSANALVVSGVGGIANVNVAGGKTLTVGTLTMSDGTGLTVNAEDTGTLAVTGNLTMVATSKVYLEKGTLRLEGSGGVAGAEVQVFQDATLDVRGSLTGNVSVSSGGVLTGTGAVNGFVTVNGGGIAPGAGVGILSVDTFVADAASNFDFQIGGTIAGIGYDQLKITGSDFELGGAQLNLTVNGILTPSSILTLVMNLGGDVSFGTFAGLPSGATIALAGGQEARISYYDNPGTPAFETTGVNQTNVSLLVTVPEPGSAALLLGGLASVMGLRRRRRA